MVEQSGRIRGHEAGISERRPSGTFCPLFMAPRRKSTLFYVLDYDVSVSVTQVLMEPGTVVTAKIELRHTIKTEFWLRRAL